MPMIAKRKYNSQLAPNMALSHVLNFSRAGAALLVLFFHIRSTLVVPYDALDAHSGVSRAFFLITTFGHDAVIIFFVLSGYLVGGAVLRLDMKARSDLFEYWVDRSVRIGPVLIVATVLSVTLQLVAPASGCGDSPTTVLGNAVGLQNFLVRPLCNNSPLWSISNAAVYYFAFPVMIAAFLRQFSIRLALTLASVALIFALSIQFAPRDETNIVFDFPFWLVGAALWFAPGGFRRLRWLSLLMLAAALAVGRLDIGKDHFWLRDLFLAASLSLVLITFFNQPMPASGARAVLAGRLAELSRRFASLSFSLYVTHYPLIRYYIAISHHGARHKSVTIELLLEFVFLSAFCILVASAFSALFERPRRLFRRFLIERVPLSCSQELDRTRR